MKTKRTYPLLAAALAAVLSCSKESTPLGPSSPFSSELITFSAEDDMEAEIGTKAVATEETTTDNLTSFKVYCKKRSDAYSTVPVFNCDFTRGSDGKFTAPGQYWPFTDQQYAFYMSNAAIASTMTGPTVRALSTADVVVAACLNPGFKQDNAVVFSHVFSRIGTCTVTASSKYTVTGLTVKLTPKTKGTYNLATGEWSGVTAGLAVTLASALGASVDNNLYTVPGTYTVTVNYTLTRDIYSETFNKTGEVTLVAGEINDLSVALPDGNEANLTLSVNLSKWPVSKTYTETF